MTDIEIKKILLKRCNQEVSTRKEKIQQTLAGIVASLENESKSSAGDKHETGRAMLQIDRENAGKQLLEVEKLQRILPKIDIKKSTTYAHLGSLITTSKGTFFLSISIGAVIIEESSYYCVAIQAPIGRLLLGKQEGDSFNFNSNEYIINKVR